MDQQLMSQFVNEILSNINILVVVTLMAVGFIIKHVKFLEKVDNSLIPVILLVLSFVFTFIDTGLSVPSIFIAILSAAVAIGLHQQGKNIFTVTVIPWLKNLITVKKPTVSDYEDEYDEDTEEDEEE